MIIKSINIISFGGLKNVKLDFTDNLNVVFGANGAGKSTVMNFIKLMFYGKTENERCSDISKSLRKKTKPLDGSKQQGSISFIHNGIEYIIEKTFGLTANSDKVSITDITNGKTVNLEANIEPGKHFLGLSLPQFERCSYILSNDFTKLETELTDIKEFSFKKSSDADTETNKIIQELIKQKENLISKSKKKGLIVEKEAELNNLTFQISQCLNNEKIAKELDSKFNLKKSEIEGIKKDLENSIDAEATSKRLQILLNMFDFKKQILNLKNYFSKLKEENSIDEYVSFCDMLYNNTLSRFRIKDESNKKDDAINYEKLRNDFNRANSILSELSEINETMISLTNKQSFKQKIYSEKKKFKGNIFIAALTALVFVCSLIFYFKHKIMAFMLSSVAFATFFIITILSALNTSKNIKQLKVLIPDDIDIQIQKNKEQTDKLNSDLENILKANNVYDFDELNKAFYKQNAIITTDNERFENALNDSVNKFIKHISKFKHASSFEEAEEIFKELKDNYNKLKLIENEYSSFLKLSETEDMSLKELEEKISKYTDFLKENKQLSEYEKDYYNKKINDLSDELLSIKTKYPKESSSLSELQKDAEMIKAEINDLKKTYSAILLAEEAIKESANELSLDFLPKLNSVATKIISELEANKNNELIISDNVIPKVKKDLAGSFVQTGFLSESEKNRVYLSLRFALINMIENQFSDALPVFADDILASYDEESSLRAISFFNEMAKKRQIIFFTCHNELAEKFKNYLANEIIL